jgi:hypothetical protein
VPADEWHRRTLAWPVSPRIDGHALTDFLKSEEIMELLQCVHDGHELAWDGHNHVGTLDAEAHEASKQFGALLNHLSVHAKMAVIDTAEWLGSDALDELWPEGVTLKCAAATLQEQAKLEDVTLLTPVEYELLERAERAFQDGEVVGTEWLLALVEWGFVSEKSLASVTFEAAGRTVAVASMELQDVRYDTGDGGLGGLQVLVNVVVNGEPHQLLFQNEGDGVLHVAGADAGMDVEHEALGEALGLDTEDDEFRALLQEATKPACVRAQSLVDLLLAREATGAAERLAAA